jgi:biotin carboxylase
MKEALRHFTITGIETNIPFHQFILNQPDYQKGNVLTRWIENILNQSSPSGPSPDSNERGNQ